jgi:glycosyltransferase involved in cell wall biosynthesis
VHWHAFRRYSGKLDGRFDAVVDQVNTVPFLTPLWADIPRFMFIHQLAREVWWYESPFPLNLLGYLAEPLYLRFYRRSDVFTVSPSTERDLRALGFSGRITVLPEGLETIAPHPTFHKSGRPIFLYVGRFSPSKRISEILRAFAEFRLSTQELDAELWLVGNGSLKYVSALRKLAQRLALDDYVHFWGWVPAGKKHALMREAYALLMASAREGWGLAVIEANACGTPAIVYNVPGLRDAVRHEQTGLIVRPNPLSLGDGMKRLWTDAGLYARVSNEAKAWSGSFSFDRTTSVVLDEFKRGIASVPAAALG